MRLGEGDIPPCVWWEGCGVEGSGLFSRLAGRGRVRPTTRLVGGGEQGVSPHVLGGGGGASLLRPGVGGVEGGVST